MGEYKARTIFSNVDVKGGKKICTQNPIVMDFHILLNFCLIRDQVNNEQMWFSSVPRPHWSNPDKLKSICEELLLEEGKCEVCVCGQLLIIRKPVRGGHTRCDFI